MKITKEELAACGTGTIERTEFCQRIGNTVILTLKEPDGTFKRHYHRYKTEAKAQAYYEWWATELPH